MTDQIKQDINALVDSPRQSRSLPPVEPVGGYPSGRGVAAYQASGGTGGGGGIASPLTEPSYAARQYHNSNVVTMASYLIGVKLRPVKMIAMQDADGNPVIMNYAEPTT